MLPGAAEVERRPEGLVQPRLLRVVPGSGAPLPLDRGPAPLSGLWSRPGGRGPGAAKGIALWTCALSWRQPLERLPKAAALKVTQVRGAEDAGRTGHRTSWSVLRWPRDEPPPLGSRETGTSRVGRDRAAWSSQAPAGGLREARAVPLEGTSPPRPSCLSSPSFPLCEACFLQLVSRGISHGHPWCQRAVPRAQGVPSSILWPSHLVYRTFLRLLPLLSKQWTHRKLAAESCSPFWWRRALSCWGPGLGAGSVQSLEWRPPGPPWLQAVANRIPGTVLRDARADRSPKESEGAGASFSSRGVRDCSPRAHRTPLLMDCNSVLCVTLLEEVLIFQAFVEPSILVLLSLGDSFAPS